jgi:hypothetical protein
MIDIVTRTSISVKAEGERRRAEGGGILPSPLSSLLSPFSTAHWLLFLIASPLPLCEN